MNIATHRGFAWRELLCSVPWAKASLLWAQSQKLSCGDRAIYSCDVSYLQMTPNVRIKLIKSNRTKSENPLRFNRAIHVSVDPSVFARAEDSSIARCKSNSNEGSGAATTSIW